MALNDFFQFIAQHYNRKLPFVVYRKPNSNAVKGMLQNNDELFITSKFEETGFVFSPFDNESDTIIIPSKQSESLAVNYSEMNVISKLNHIATQVSDTEKEHHISLVEKGVAAIEHGGFQKVVLSRKEEIELENIDVFSIYRNLLASYKSAFVYCWYHPKIGLWLGATPETLLKIEGRHFSMMALAGTQDYHGSLEVQWRDKELQEQQFVTDFILDNIKSTVENIKTSEVETVKAGNLLHLRTLIKGNLIHQNLSLKQLLENLHPTPAVCGLPKKKAKDFILENENYNRSFYTGFLGELNFEIDTKPRTGARNIENRAYSIKKKSTQLYVNLRCMQLKDKKAIVYVGGGITATSKPEQEWEETVSKSKVVKNVL